MQLRAGPVTLADVDHTNQGQLWRVFIGNMVTQKYGQMGVWLHANMVINNMITLEYSLYEYNHMEI